MRLVVPACSAIMAAGLIAGLIGFAAGAGPGPPDLDPTQPVDPALELAQPADIEPARIAAAIGDSGSSPT